MSGEETNVVNNTPLPGNKVPTGSIAVLRLVISPPPKSEPVRSPVPLPGEAGTFQFPGAAGQEGPLAQKFRVVRPSVNVPFNCNVPIMGDAIAGADRRINAAQAKP